jgi:hypothetical protein
MMARPAGAQPRSPPNPTLRLSQGPYLTGALPPARSTALVPGDFPRVVFRHAPNHRHDEPWQQRPVRTPPTAPDGSKIGRMAYFNNSKTAANSNVLQVILRDHGYHRVESMEDDWCIFWCAGQIELSELKALKAHQKARDRTNGIAPPPLPPEASYGLPSRLTDRRALSLVGTRRSTSSRAPRR